MRALSRSQVRCHFDAGLLFTVWCAQQLALCTTLDRSSEALSERAAALKTLKKELRPLIGAVWLGQASKVAAYLIAAGEVLLDRP